MFFNKVGYESSGYQLTVGGYSGNAGDTIGRASNGMKFTTKDRDNDRYRGNCAVATCDYCAHGGGWWYNSCSKEKINSPYNSTLRSFSWELLPIDADRIRKLTFSRMTLV